MQTTTETTHPPSTPTSPTTTTGTGTLASFPKSLAQRVFEFTQQVEAKAKSDTQPLALALLMATHPRCGSHFCCPAQSGHTTLNYCEQPSNAQCHCASMGSLEVLDGSVVRLIWCSLVNVIVSRHWVKNIPKTKYHGRFFNEYKKIVERINPAIPLSIDEADPLHLIGTITGPAGSPYEAGKFRVSVRLSPGYPIDSPSVQFLTKIHHPGVSAEGMLRPIIPWSPVIPILSLLERLQILQLGAPEGDIDHPMDTTVASHWSQDREAAIAKANEWTALYARDPDTQTDFRKW
ncbi:ubiquitin-conjugating enzyme E2 N [Pelomyxa schiedti]|nr:ubiquitin-conjugating enzyme E2 N [Pelomyxa schiedti]